MEKIVIEEKQSRALRLALASLLFLLLSIVIWIFGMKEKRVILWLLGFGSTVFFGIRFFIYLGRTINCKPLITITFDGIIDSTSDGSVGFISFGDIEKFCIITLSGEKVIGIIPKDQETFLNKLSPIKQRIAITNIKLNYPPLFFKVNKAKDMSLEDIYTLLKKRLDDYSSLYD